VQGPATNHERLVALEVLNPHRSGTPARRCDRGISLRPRLGPGTVAGPCLALNPLLVPVLPVGATDRLWNPGLIAPWLTALKALRPAPPCTGVFRPGPGPLGVPALLPPPTRIRALLSPMRLHASQVPLLCWVTAVNEWGAAAGARGCRLSARLPGIGPAEFQVLTSDFWCNHLAKKTLRPSQIHQLI
jgi:hypothetical protein